MRIKVLLSIFFILFFLFLFIFEVRGFGNAPTYSLNSTNSTLAGSAVLHSLYWQDDFGLSGYIFSWCNGNYSYMQTIIYNYTSPDQEASTKRFYTTSSQTTTQKTKYYNTSLGASIVKAYGVSTDTNTVTTSSTKNFGTATNPTFAETFGAPPYNFTQLGYERISTSDNTYGNLISNANNLEPFGIYNFTIQEDKSTINWIYIELEQSEATAGSTGTGEYCYYGVANWSSSTWFQFGSYVNGQTDTTRTYNFTTQTLINQFVNSNNVLSMINWGANMDANEGCRIDFVRVRVNYNETAYSPVYEQNSTSYIYDGIDGDDYQNVGKVGAIITIDFYNPSASNSTYHNNNRPDIEVAFWDGSTYSYNTTCQIYNFMGSNLPNTTDWNCTIYKTDSNLLNAWKNKANRRVAIRALWLDAHNGNIYDEINITNVYGYVDGWNQTLQEGECSEENAILTNDTWSPFEGNPTSAWTNVTKTVTSQVGKTIKWRVYANDTDNNWNVSEIFSYVTTVPTYQYLVNISQSTSFYLTFMSTKRYTKTSSQSFLGNFFIAESQYLVRQNYGQIQPSLLFVYISNRVRGLSQIFSTYSISQKLSIINKQLSQFFDINVFVDRGLSVIKNIFQSSTIQTLNLRAIFVFKTLSQLVNFYLTSFVQLPFAVYERIIGFSFNIFSNLQKVISLVRFEQAYSTISIVSLRLQDVIRSSNQILIFNIFEERILDLKNYFWQGLNLNFMILRGQNLFKSVSQSLSSISIFERITGILKVAEQKLNMQSNFLRAITENRLGSLNILLHTSAQRLVVLVKNFLSPIFSNITILENINIQRRIGQSFQNILIVQRLVSKNIFSINTINIFYETSRVVGWVREFGQQIYQQIIIISNKIATVIIEIFFGVQDISNVTATKILPTTFFYQIPVGKTTFYWYGIPVTVELTSPKETWYSGETGVFYLKISTLPTKEKVFRGFMYMMNLETKEIVDRWNFEYAVHSEAVFEIKRELNYPEGDYGLVVVFRDTFNDVRVASVFRVRGEKPFFYRYFPIIAITFVFFLTFIVGSYHKKIMIIISKRRRKEKQKQNI